jgi:hypothetical protein
MWGFKLFQIAADALQTKKMLPISPNGRYHMSKFGFFFFFFFTTAGYASCWDGYIIKLGRMGNCSATSLPSLFEKVAS